MVEVEKTSQKERNKQNLVLKKRIKFHTQKKGKEEYWLNFQISSLKIRLGGFNLDMSGWPTASESYQTTDHLFEYFKIYRSIRRPIGMSIYPQYNILICQIEEKIESLSEKPTKQSNSTMSTTTPRD